MRVEHSFSLPAPPSQVWPVLLDIERVAACLPAVTLDSVEGGTFRGSLKVRIGASTVTCSGTARLLRVDEAARRVVLEVRDGRTDDSAAADVTVAASLRDDAGRSAVEIVSEVATEGEHSDPGVVSGAVENLHHQLADCVRAQVSGAPAPPPVVAVAEPAAGAVIAATSGAGTGQARPLGTLPRPEAAPAPALPSAGLRRVASAGLRRVDSAGLRRVAAGRALARAASVLGVGAALVAVWRRWRGTNGADLRRRCSGRVRGRGPRRGPPR